MSTSWSSVPSTASTDEEITLSFYTTAGLYAARFRVYAENDDDSAELLNLSITDDLMEGDSDHMGASYSFSYAFDAETYGPLFDADSESLTVYVKVSVQPSRNSSATTASSLRSITLSLNSSIVPTVSDITATEAGTAGDYSIFDGEFAQSFTALALSASASGVYGSTIASVTFNVACTDYDGELEFADEDDETSATATATTDVLTVYGEQTITCTATDSRGRIGTGTFGIKLLQYFVPVAKLAYTRSGTTVTITGTGTVCDVNSLNTASMLIEAYRASDETDYQSQEYDIGTVTSSTSTFSKSKAFTLDYLDTETYTLVVTVTDAIQSTSASNATGAICFSLLAGGQGAAFGRSAETASLLDVAWDISSDGTITAASMAETSDRRLKQDIHRLRDTSLLDCLSPVSFRFLDNTDTHYGFVAQDVPDANLVREDAKGYLTLDYIGIIPLLVGRIQELEARLRALEEEEDKA